MYINIYIYIYIYTYIHGYVYIYTHPIIHILAHAACFQVLLGLLYVLRMCVAVYKTHNILRMSRTLSVK